MRPLIADLVASLLGNRRRRDNRFVPYSLGGRPHVSVQV